MGGAVMLHSPPKRQILQDFILEIEAKDTVSGALLSWCSAIYPVRRRHPFGAIGRV
jgi:hypothetical protein